MGEPGRRSRETAVLTREGTPRGCGSTVKVLFGIAAVAWLGVGHTLRAQTETRWVLAATTAALALTAAAIAAAAVAILAGMLDANGRRTMHAMHEQIENAREQADRIVAATHQHADRRETSTKGHSREMQEQIFNLNWLMLAQREGEIRAERDARHGLDGFKPSDTGPFPIVRNGR